MLNNILFDGLECEDDKENVVTSYQLAADFYSGDEFYLEKSCGVLCVYLTNFCVLGMITNCFLLYILYLGVKKSKCCQNIQALLL